MNRIVITGANGFIGSALCNYFSNKSYDVIQWIYGERFDIDHKSKVVCLDMSDDRQIVEALLAFTPDIIIHCAGSADVAKSVSNPFVDFQGNVKVTHNLLFSLHILKLDHIRFVFLSSAAVYGNPISLPIREDMPLNPLSPYAIHKVICEELCFQDAEEFLFQSNCSKLRIIQRKDQWEELIDKDAMDASLCVVGNSDAIAPDDSWEVYKL